MKVGTISFLVMLAGSSILWAMSMRSKVVDQQAEIAALRYAAEQQRAEMEEMAAELKKRDAVIAERDRIVAELSRKTAADLAALEEARNDPSVAAWTADIVPAAVAGLLKAGAGDRRADSETDSAGGAHDGR